VYVWSKNSECSGFQRTTILTVGVNGSGSHAVASESACSYRNGQGSRAAGARAARQPRLRPQQARKSLRPTDSTQADSAAGAPRAAQSRAQSVERAGRWKPRQGWLRPLDADEGPKRRISIGVHRYRAIWPGQMMANKSCKSQGSYALTSLNRTRSIRRKIPAYETIFRRFAELGLSRTVADEFDVRGAVGARRASSNAPLPQNAYRTRSPEGDSRWRYGRVDRGGNFALIDD
jgi:hypothetical protein